MKVLKTVSELGQLPDGCVLTIGNFDGVHRGHQAMLALLTSEARHRGLPSCVLTFEPHPRDHFARKAGRADSAPARVSTLRDKLAELERHLEGHDHAIKSLFDAIRQLMAPPVEPKREIGFHIKEDTVPYRIKRK